MLAIKNPNNNKSFFLFTTTLLLSIRTYGSTQAFQKYSDFLCPLHVDIASLSVKRREKMSNRFWTTGYSLPKCSFTEQC